MYVVVSEQYGKPKGVTIEEIVSMTHNIQEDQNKKVKKWNPQGPYGCGWKEFIKSFLLGLAISLL